MNEHLIINQQFVDQESPTKLFGDGVIVAASAFGIPQTVEFERDVYNHMLNHQVLFAYDPSGEPMGFTSYEHLTDGSMSVLYISGTVVKQEYQGKGIGATLTEKALEEARKRGSIDYIAGRTQNPVVARSREHYCSPVYPIREVPDESIVRAGLMVHRHLGLINPMDPITLVTKNAYANPMYRARPMSGHQAIDRFFDRHVGPRDAVFIIGRPKL